MLRLPAVAEINRELGFSRSSRSPAMGRWKDAVHSWLNYRESNPQLLNGIVKAGLRQTAIGLAQKSRYKPQSSQFFQTLRWKQKQSKDGRRTLAIGDEVEAAETWASLTEAQICEKIVAERPNYKRIVGLLPNGLTRAIMAAAVEAGSLSDKDLIIQTPTLEGLGLLKVKEVKERWDSAVKRAEDQRSANIAARVQSKEVKDKLQEAADTAVKKAVEEVTKGMRVYFMVDISSSMGQAIVQAKEYIATFLQAFPEDKIHISTFNTIGREVKLRHSSKAGVEQAFRGIRASGGTLYEAGFQLWRDHKSSEEEDVLFFYVGDEEAHEFSQAVRDSGLSPVAMAFVKIKSSWGFNGTAVHDTCSILGIPCLDVDPSTFSDPYATPRTLRNLIASTPVGRSAPRRVIQRESLVDTILKTELLKKPVWSVG